MNNILKYISISLVISILFIVTSLPIYGATEDLDPLDPPSDSYPVTGTDFFMWYLSSATGYTAPDLDQYTLTDVVSLSSLANTNYVWCYPFTNIESTTGDQLKFEPDCTYVLRLQFNQGPFSSLQGSLSNFNPRLSTGPLMPLEDTYDLGNFVTDNSISTVVVSSSNIVDINLIFHMSESTPLPCYWVAPFLYLTGSSIVYLKYNMVKGFYDPDLSIFESMISGQIDELKDAINAAADQAHEDSLKEQEWLQNIEEAISGGEEVDADRDSIDDLGQVEGDLMDNVSSVTLPDGSSISASSNVFEQLDSWVKSEFSPAEFNESASTIFDDIFDVFMPYVGIVILLNLSLALGISFLSGRRAGT